MFLFSQSGPKEAANRIGFGETVVRRRAGVRVLSRAASEIENGLLPKYPERPAVRLTAQDASPSITREKELTAYHYALMQLTKQASY